MIKTRSMSSAASSSKPPTIAFGGHVPPKQPAKPKPRANRHTKPARVTRPANEQTQTNQKQQLTASDRRPATRQKTSHKPKPETQSSSNPSAAPIESTPESDRANKTANQPLENQPNPDLPPQTTSATLQASPKPTVVIPRLSPLSASTSSQTAPTPAVTIPSPPSQATLNTSQAAPEPIVIIPTHPGISSSKANTKLPVSATEPLSCDPPKASCSSTSTLPPTNPPSHSHLPRRIPPPKVNNTDRPRKRLFEDVDNSSNDIFSFLDHNPRSKKLIKPATRPVFKPSQPSFLKSTRITSESEVAKNKHRALASNKLLAGAQPQAKKLKKAHPGSSLTTRESQLPGTSAHIGKPTAEPEKSKPQPSSTHHHESQLISDPSAMTVTIPSKEAVLPTQALTTTTSTLDQPVPTLNDEHEPTPQESSPLLPVEPTPPAPSHLLTLVKHPSDVNLTEPLPPTLSPSIHQPSSLDPSTSQTEEISADAIDFLSPKKPDKQSSQPDPDSHQGDREAAQTDTSSDLTQFSSKDASLPLAAVCDSKESNDKYEDSDSQSPKVCSHAPPLDQSSIPQTETSRLLGSPDIPPALPAQPSTTSDVEPLLPQPSSDSMEPPVHAHELLLKAVSKNVTSSSIRAATPEPMVETESTTPKPSPKFIPTRTSPIKHPTLPTSIPIMCPQPSALPQTITHQLSTSGLLIEQAAKRPSMLPRKALKPSMGTSQPLTFNVIPSLDAIIENSPEKKPVRDALSASSLNRPRGFGGPSRMFLGGGMKAKADGIFSRAPVGLDACSTGASGMHSRGMHRELSKAAGHQSHAERTEELEPESQNINENAPEDDDGSVDTSTTSIATHQSYTTDSSMTSSGEPSQPQFSGNISLDTQDRLLKLQNMLTRMGRSETAPGGSRSSSDQVDNRSRYKDYEVPLKDEPEEIHAGRPSTTGVSSRSRRRSSSVPLNYAEDNLSRSVSRAHNPPVRGQPKAGPPAQRRASNILPSVRPDISSPGQGTNGSSAAASSSKDRLSASVSAGSNPSFASAARNDRLRRQLAPTPLKDVVAFVDVRTAEGDDAGKVFVEMLKGLGAKVLGRPTFPLTHIIFKAGKPTTLEKYMHHPRPKPALVGIGWVVRCREIVGRAEERPYTIDMASAQAMPFFNPDHPSHPALQCTGPMNISGHIPPTGNANHRRKSMEPKALSLLNSGLQLNHSSSAASSSTTTTTTSTTTANPDPSAARNALSRSCISKPVTATSSSNTGANATVAGQPDERNHVLAQSIEKARRKSLQFLPKVGSPLASKVFLPGDDGHEQHPTPAEAPTGTDPAPSSPSPKAVPL
ncbi:hypothetical protein PtA15_7A750 [Puccinia triticina]|uniref:BRCT domain-containing protein n=1 Tax=Puccinia triticina TaxID=208348 RepID=A0ABY7CP45_9BASI|nr:uncharacterized protein PtA15_7A750 [Puccinia triticina]WAQ87021.1 hypothetical protein PtA15_7A750 [Puccinia triticina]WAR56876.1 hypothetical protein PtB15_7B728 [Puccinia triticina]